MDSSKQSNKISDIVKLKRMLKKWRIQASSASSYTSIRDSSNDNNCNSDNIKQKGSLSRTNSDNIKPKGSLSRTSSDKINKKGSLSRSNSSNNSNSKKASLSRNNSIKGIKFLKRTLSFTDLSSPTASSSNAVPKGFLAVQVGEEMKRFVIPTNYLSHQAFSILLKEAEEEFGFQQEGILRIPCEVEEFENILRMVDVKNIPRAKQALKISRKDSTVCGSSESQSLSKAHHPPSPMCR